MAKQEFRPDAKDYEAIARRAFELYVERGCEDGHDLEDWLRAEREVMEAPHHAAMFRPRPRKQAQTG